MINIFLQYYTKYFYKLKKELTIFKFKFINVESYLTCPNA